MDFLFKDFNSYSEMLNSLKSSDLLICSDLCSLAQNMKELEKRIKEILSLNASIYFQKENLKFTPDKTQEQEFLIHLLENFKDFEQENILKRRRLGIQKAKEAGKYAKERRKKLPSNIQEVLLQERENGLSVSKIIAKYNISRKTFYNYSKNSTTNILKDISILLKNDLKTE